MMLLVVFIDNYFSRALDHVYPLPYRSAGSAGA